MFVTPDFTHEDVRATWQSVIDDGVDLGDLMLVLDDSYDHLLKSDGQADP